MKYLNFLFHIYQPPVQDYDILGAIVRESYEPLTRKIREAKDMKFTLNINYSLVELLNAPFPGTLDNIKTAYESGILELTETGAYHPIFPLIPACEVEKQIQINHQGNQRLLSPVFKPEGVFPPEMAFTGGLASQFKSLGYQWTIADDGNLDYYGIEVPYNKIYCQDDFGVFLRSNYWSNRFANDTNTWSCGKDFVDDLLECMQHWMGEQDGYLIIALDGESFGHHQKKFNEDFLGELFDALVDSKDKLRTVHLSELYQRFPKTAQFIPPGSWSSDRIDIQNRDYFSWWKSHRNEIHRLHWLFIDLVLESVRNQNETSLNEDMDKALYSCQFWWAGYWKFDPKEIYKGVFNLRRILHKSTDLSRDKSTLHQGESIFRQLVTEIEKKKHTVEVC